MASHWKRIALLQAGLNTKPGQGSGSWAKRTSVILGVNTKPGGGHGSSARRLVEKLGAKGNKGSWARRLVTPAIRIGKEPWSQILFDAGGPS